MNESEQTVFVVDDEKSVRDSIRWLLESIRLTVRTFESAEQFLEEFSADRGGCLVLDVRMPGMSGPELMDCLSARGSPLPIIFLSAHGDVPLAVRAMKGGAVDFLQKPYNNQVFLERVRQALDQDAQQRRQRLRHDGVAERLGALTERERQVLDGVVAGQSNKVIARELDISYKTVEAHRSRLMQKMDAHSVAELLQMVLTCGSRAA
ncbi:MAG: response regulator transcription factor [Sinimarinibacterium flocculans]|uniref:response regulator transcription factor n=1 Tax=Sinimarinibacterium flocculans TaxID=985250 RepID=UPI0024913DC6|nr:response regulator transcription factor [Sinimarinibacterium flocculans]MEC9361806.1 response regulator transcription factor [Pseudomonadota bacterium]